MSVLIQVVIVFALKVFLSITEKNLAFCDDVKNLPGFKNLQSNISIQV